MPERAKIEAVEAILNRMIDAASRAGTDGTLPAETVRVECLRATYALDRVRDARGDDEGPKVTVEPGRRPFDPAKAARSPQSEDHKHSWHPVWRCRHCGLVQPPAPSRDARGDDEAVRDDHDGHWTTTYHRCASCGAMTSAARFPQGEDHEAAWRGEEHQWEQGSSGAGDSSPSRDGTVAVEDWRNDRGPVGFASA